MSQGKIAPFIVRDVSCVVVFVALICYNTQHLEFDKEGD